MHMDVIVICIGTGIAFVMCVRINLFGGAFGETKERASFTDSFM